MKRLPKEQLDLFISNTKDLLSDKEELEIYNELKKSGIIDNLKKLSKNKRIKSIEIMNNTVVKNENEIEENKDKGFGTL